MKKKSVLFYSVLTVFLGTAIVTVLGIAGIMHVKPEHISYLLPTLIGQVIVAVITLFKGTNFFDDESEEIKRLKTELSEIRKNKSDNDLEQKDIDKCETCQNYLQEIADLKTKVEGYNSLSSALKGMLSHERAVSLGEIEERFKEKYSDIEIFSAISQLVDNNHIKAYSQNTWVKA